MYKKILVATDGSELATKAVEHGTALAKSVGASVVFVTVTEFWSALEIASEFEEGDFEAVKAYEAAAARSAKAILDKCGEQAASKGVDSVQRHVSDHKPAEGILDTAEKEDCDLIIMATHGRKGIERILIGSQTTKVISLSSRPVLVLH